VVDCFRLRLLSFDGRSRRVAPRNDVETHGRRLAT
jgi:hypothetical protein